ncbi:MAG: hypothetical protein IH946_05645, partial [Bacteroidetes bacterium]|nr:hypothetical protein [Bacteroidota bacterium]
YFETKLQKGGYCIIDDYNYPDLPGCRQAVDEFCEAHSNSVKVVEDVGQARILEKT